MFALTGLEQKSSIHIWATLKLNLTNGTRYGPTEIFSLSILKKKMEEKWICISYSRRMHAMTVTHKLGYCAVSGKLLFGDFFSNEIRLSIWCEITICIFPWNENILINNLALLNGSCSFCVFFHNECDFFLSLTDSNSSYQMQCSH